MPRILNDLSETLRKVGCQNVVSDTSISVIGRLKELTDHLGVPSALNISFIDITHDNFYVDYDRVLNRNELYACTNHRKFVLEEIPEPGEIILAYDISALNVLESLAQLSVNVIDLATYGLAKKNRNRIYSVRNQG